MSDNTVLAEREFWKTLEAITKLKQEIDLEFFLSQNQIDRNILNKAFYFMEQLGQSFRIENNGRSDQIIPPSFTPKVKLELDLLEWLSFQAHFPCLESFRNQPFHESTVQTLARFEAENSGLDYFKALEQTNMLENNEYEEIKKLIDDSIEGQTPLNLKLGAGNYTKIFPRKLVHISGDLSLVGEEIVDGSIVCIGLTFIESIEIDQDQYQTQYSKIEIDDFIASIRAVEDSEVRLILKIKSQQLGELRPPHQYLGNPYVVTNTEGETIWAASVEPSDQLYQWIGSLGEGVEVLDPESCRIAFQQYLGQKGKIEQFPKKKSA